jgi:sensor histidine kinase YesM
LIWFFIGCFSLICNASDLPTLTLNISRDSQDLALTWKAWLLQNAEVFVDSTGLKTFDVMPQQRFVPLPQQHITRFLSLGHTRNRYWVRFNVHNTHSQDTLWLSFWTKHPYIRIFDLKKIGRIETNFDFFLPINAAHEGEKMSKTYPFFTLPLDTTCLYVCFGERATESFDWFINVQTKHATHIDFLEYTLATEPKFLFNAFFFGTLVLMSLIALLFFQFTRQWAYFFYAMYLFALFLTFLRSFEDHSFYTFLYSYFPISFKWSEGIWAVAAQISYNYFLIHVMDLKEKKHRAYNVIRGVIVFTWVYLVLDFGLEFFFFKEDRATELYVLFRISSAFLGLYILWCLRDIKTRVSRLVIYGTLSLLFGVLLAMPFSVYQTKYIYLDHLWLMKTGVFLEMLFFTAALAYRNQEIERERLEKLKENNALLIQLTNQAELKRQAAEAELKHTRAQMRSHLLFNVINNAKNQVLLGKPNEAAAQLSDLAGFMRLGLNHSRTPTVSLEDELKILKKYIDLEKKRLSDAFTLVWQCEEGPSVFSTQVPSFLLQPFVENAILHGLLLKSNENERILSVSVKKEIDTIICKIEDNGVGRPKENVETSSMGLSLTKERVALFNQIHQTKITWAIHDLADTDGVILGTKVVVEIPC